MLLNILTKVQPENVLKNMNKMNFLDQNFELLNNFMQHILSCFK